MIRTDLIRRLTELETLTPAACFALLWLHFEESGVTEGENLLRRQRIHPTRLALLEGYPSPPSRTPHGLVSTLENLPGQRIRPNSTSSLSGGSSPSTGSSRTATSRYLHGRKPWRTTKDLQGAPLPERFPRRALRGLWKGRHLGGRAEPFSATYCTHHTLVPDRVVDVRIDVKPESDWGNPFLHNRLREERSRLSFFSASPDPDRLCEPRRPQGESATRVRRASGTSGTRRISGEMSSRPWKPLARSKPQF